MRFKQFILAGFILLKLVLQYQLVSPVYELHRDEFLHLDLGHHLAWGYRSVPPFTAWVSALIGIVGNSEFWVKFFFGTLWGIDHPGSLENHRGFERQPLCLDIRIGRSAMLRLVKIKYPVPAQLL